MENSNLVFGIFQALVLGVFGAASPSPPGADPTLLSLVPPSAAVVAEVTYGVQPTFLVLTRKNKADLLDFQAISGVDPGRMIERTIFVADRGGQGLISQHSLLAIGRFDPNHIFKAAVENGAIPTEYRGIRVLLVPPLRRDKAASRDVHWLAFIGSQFALFGTIPMVQEELSRYLARSPADLALLSRLSRLRLRDQSWCVLTPTAYNREIIRRTLGALDPSHGQPDDANEGLILGFHFGKRVEIEYGSISEFGNSEESQAEAPAGTLVGAASGSLAPYTYPFRNADTTFYKVIKLSHKQYDEFISQRRPEN
jgi:hypothetical protein